MKRGTVHTALVLLTLSACGLVTSDADRIEAASQSMADGDYRAANIELKSVLRRNPDNAEARLLLAQVSLGLNDAVSARKEMLRAAELGAPDETIEELNIRILALEGQYTELLAALANPELSIPEEMLLRFRGEALLALENAEAASSTYREWLKIDPDSADAAVGAAVTMALSGDVEGAMGSLEALVSKHPRHAGGWQALGMLRYQLGQFEESRSAYRKALEYMRPEENIRRNLATLLGLADAELMLQNAEQARDINNRLVALAPSSPPVLLQKARVAYLEQDYYEAAAVLGELNEMLPRDIGVKMFFANVNMRLGLPQQAERLYRQVIALSPDNALARKRLAEIWLRQANVEGAVEVLSPLLEDSGGDADIIGLLATASFQQGDEAAAVRQFEQAAAAEPENLSRQLTLAEAYLRAGRAADAIDVLTGIDSGSEPVAVRSLLVLAYSELGDFAAASAVVDELETQFGDSSDALNAAAGYFAATGDADRARELYERSIEFDSGNAGTYVSLAQLDYRENRHIEARRHYEEALDRDATNLTALLAVAQSEARDGDKNRAIEYLERAREAHPGQLSPRLLLATMYLDAGDRNAAESVAREMSAIGSDQSAVNTVIGNILIETGALEEANSHYQAAVRQSPDSVSALLGLARSQMATGRSEEARITLTKVLRLDPDNILAVPAAALVDLRLGNTNEALQQLEQHVSRYPNDLNGLSILGDVYSDLGEHEMAVSAYGRAVAAGGGVALVLKEYHARLKAQDNPPLPLTSWLESHPDDDAVRAQLAEHYQSVGERQAAVREYEHLIQSDGSNPVYLNNLAWIYQQMGELERAEELARRAFEIRPDSAEIADTLGWIQHEMGSSEESKALLLKAAEAAPGNADIAYHLAAVLAEAGQRQEAEAILRPILESDDDFASRPAAQALLDNL